MEDSAFEIHRRKQWEESPKFFRDTVVYIGSLIPEDFKTEGRRIAAEYPYCIVMLIATITVIMLLLNLYFGHYYLLNKLCREYPVLDVLIHSDKECSNQKTEPKPRRVQLKSQLSRRIRSSKNR